MTTTPKNLLQLIALGALLFAPGLTRADEAADAAAAENHLRELRDALKSMTLQLRDAQNQVVTAQAAQTAAEDANKDLQTKLDDVTAKLNTATSQAIADKSASEKTIADFTAQVADQTGQIGRLNDDLKKQKDAYNQVAQLEAVKEAERLKLAGQVILLQRLVSDRETKNLALFKTGNEILTRYEQFSLGDAIGAKEPFVGLTRVKLETLVQDYKDKLLDQAITSGQQPAPLPSATAAPAPAAKPSAKPAAATTAKPDKNSVSLQP